MPTSHTDGGPTGAALNRQPYRSFYVRAFPLSTGAAFQGFLVRSEGGRICCDFNSLPSEPDQKVPIRPKGVFAIPFPVLG